MIVDVTGKNFFLLHEYKHIQDGQWPNHFALLRFLSEPDNIGNTVFLDAINAHVRGLINITATEFIRTASDIPLNSTIVLPFANFISETWIAPPGLMDALERFRIVLFSVGLQSTLDQQEDLNLSNDAEALLSLVQRSGTVIGARGEITKSLLYSRGITNVSVIGCPSVYIAKQLDGRIGRKETYSICTSNTMRGIHRSIAMDVNEFSIKHASGYMLQTEAGILADVLNLPEHIVDYIAGISENPDHAELLRNKWFDYGYYNPNPEKWTTYRNWFKSSARFFVRSDTWRAYAKNFDFCVGTRFHGSVVALQSDVIPIVIPVDSRVKEMCEFHGLPTISASQFDANLSPDELVDYGQLGEFSDKYTRNLAVFVEFIKNNFEGSNK
jgi:hypothetical protein